MLAPLGSCGDLKADGTTTAAAHVGGRDCVTKREAQGFHRGQS